MGAGNIWVDRETFNSRPDTSEATKVIASMPPGHCLGALEIIKCTLKIYTFLILMPLPKGKMPWCPCPFKKTKHTGLRQCGWIHKLLNLCDCQEFSKHRDAN